MLAKCPEYQFAGMGCRNPAGFSDQQYNCPESGTGGDVHD